jgi:hypothetical protein
MRDPAANERLTALAAVPLLVLLAIEGVTLLFLRPLLSVHVFVGLLLVAPVALKLASTGWRALRYYRGDRSITPPRLLLRLLAPVLVLSTVAVLGSGIAAIALGPRHTGIALTLHKASFVVWGPVFGLHVLAYVWRVPRLALATAWTQRAAVAAVLVIAVAATASGYDALHVDADDWFS